MRSVHGVIGRDDGRTLRLRRTSCFLVVSMLIVASVAACTDSEDPPESVSIDAGGGVVATPDGGITINAPAGSAEDGTLGEY